EVNNDYFTIQRSKDGIYFEPIGKINGAGSTLKEQSYSFTDNDPYIEDISYYRLKQTDLNGNYGYSKLVSVDRTGISDLTVYPNPSKDGIFIIMTDFFSNTSNFYEVLDYSGRKIIEQKIQSNKSVLDLSGNAKGLYILRSTINGKTTSKKVVFN
ncbi:MAG: T9SS type A sorting domain-containing protein, partial [Bacteroidia bacterium]|nr:T9SS type A sorting domain-containing protein [Bacteroidia bacterium]